MDNFWSILKKPIYALAPMAGITDSAFRQICKGFGADVVYSEMASATALLYNPKKTLEMLVSAKKEAPYVVQLFGSDPGHFAQAIKVLTDKKVKIKMGGAEYRIPHGIDLNFGCPVKKILKQGAGAVLMGDFKKSREIIKSVIANTDLPVSIKTRSSAGEINVLKFLDNIKDLDIKTVMIHGRTLNQGFVGPMDFEIIKKARNFFDGVILANGGINTPDEAERVLKETGADGIGIARGAMGRPWIFKQLRIKNYSSSAALAKGDELRIDEIKKVILKHVKLVEELKGERGIVEIRGHLCAYLNGWPGARQLRGEMVKVKNLAKIKKILEKI